MYSLNILLFFFQELSFLSYLAILYGKIIVFFISNFVLIIIYLVTLVFAYSNLKSWLIGKTKNSTFSKFVIAFSINDTVLVNVANYNVNIFKQIKIIYNV